MTSEEIVGYLESLESDLHSGTNGAEARVRYDVDMRFEPVTLVENRRVADDICILTFDRKIEIAAGEFVFLWIPGVGEKPFSALTDDPFSLVVINLGQFTEHLLTLPPGTKAYVRGPHGQSAAPPADAHIVGVALAWLRYISWPETMLAKPTSSSGRAAQSDCTFWRSAPRALPCTLPRTMAAGVSTAW